jgi:uroporphyrinogen decarboxylase
MQPIRRYEGLLDGAIIFSDILVIPQALDMEVIMNPGPIFPAPITTAEEMVEMVERRLTAEELKRKLNYVYEAIKLTSGELAERIPLIGFVGAPWTLFAYMTSGGGGSGGGGGAGAGLNGSKATSFDTAKRWLQTQPELAGRLLEKLAQICALHLANQVVAGCQLVQVFDSWAGELSDYDFAHFSLPYLQRVATLLTHHLAEENLDPVPMIVFAKGANLPGQLQQLAQAGYSAISLDWKVRPAYAIHALGPASDTIALQGNLDPAILHTNHDTIKKYVQIMFDKEHGGFQGHLPHIANLGHGITPGVDPEAMRTFLQAVHDESAKIRLHS